MQFAILTCIYLFYKKVFTILYNTKIRKQFVLNGKILIEQLLNSKISLTKIKSIIDNVDKVNKQENLNETTTANTNGLRIITCQGCHKSPFEDKFMLNKTQKRYRSCINCVLRSRKNTAKEGTPAKH